MYAFSNCVKGMEREASPVSTKSKALTAAWRRLSSSSLTISTERRIVMVERLGRPLEIRVDRGEASILGQLRGA